MEASSLFGIEKGEKEKEVTCTFFFVRATPFPRFQQVAGQDKDQKKPENKNKINVASFVVKIEFKIPPNMDDGYCSSVDVWPK